MKILHKVVYTIPHPDFGCVELSADIIRKRRLTYAGAERILNRESGKSNRVTVARMDVFFDER